MRVAYSLVARGFIQQGSRFVLCQAKGYDFWFLPGGGVEDGEDAVAALRREMREEVGIDVQNVAFLSVAQNRFLDKGAFENEVVLVFSGRIDENTVVMSQEDHLEIRTFSAEEMEAMNILPVSLKHVLLAYAKGSAPKPFIGYEAL